MKWIEQQHRYVKDKFLQWRQLYRSCQKHRVFGLDIGTSSIKVVELCKNENGYSVVGAGTAFVQDNNVPKSIRYSVKSAGIKTKFAVCGLCGQETTVRNFSFPPLLPEEIEGAVSLEARQVCPFNADDGTIDYQVVSGDEKEIKGYLVVAANRLLNEKARFVKDSALNPTLMDIDGLAVLNCLRYYNGGKQGISAVLNVGYSCTTLAIVGDDDLPFVRDINFAGKAIIENIAVENQVSPEVVEKIVKGSEHTPDVLVNIRENLEAASHKLISNITETLYYDAVRRKSEIVPELYLCGGFAIVDGFADLLKAKLPTEVILWNPFNRMQCSSTACRELLDKKGPTFAVAAGLAMRQI